MEQKVGIGTTLFGGPPELGNITKLANSQIGFMNIFAMPLFEGVSDILPGMKYTVEVMKSNLEIWKGKVVDEKTHNGLNIEAEKYTKDGKQSPRSGSPDRLFASTEQLSHPEGLPASGVTPQSPQSPPMNTSQGTPDLKPDHSKPAGDVNSPNSLSSNSSQSGLKSSISPLPTVPVSEGLGSPTQIQLTSGHTAAAGSGKLANGPSASSSTVTNQHTLTENISANNLPKSSIGGGYSHRLDKGGDSEAGNSQRSYSGNFSRPLSHRHSANTSFARSSAPSGTPTVASTFVAASPTESKATSFFDGASDVAVETPEAEDSERPGSGYISTVSGYSSSGRSPHPEGKFSTPLTNGHTVVGERVVRRKFRLDFWRKKKAGEMSP
jgi:3',5'-cyclic-nucleotide phosphodiesterase